MKKVLFTATVDSHILHFHLPYLKLFKEKGYEVHVASNGDETIPYCDVKHTIEFERNPLKWNNIKAYKQLKQIIETEQYDIIHCHTPVASVVTRLAARKSRKEHSIKVLYTAHGFHFFKGASWKNWLLFYPIEKIMAKHTDVLITINEEDYELAKKKFKVPHIHLIKGVGIDFKKFSSSMPTEKKEQMRKSLDIPLEAFVIIYVAELNENKNQIMAINVIEKLIKENPNIVLLLVGKDSVSGKYQKIVEEKQMQKFVKFLGYRKDVPDLMQIADLGISTSQREGLPVNIIEERATGLQVVATNCRGNRDLVEAPFLVEINDVEAMKKMIEHIIKHPEEKQPQDLNSIKEYELENIVKQMEKIYDAGE